MLGDGDGGYSQRECAKKRRCGAKGGEGEGGGGGGGEKKRTHPQTARSPRPLHLAQNPFFFPPPDPAAPYPAGLGFPSRLPTLGRCVALRVAEAADPRRQRVLLRRCARVLGICLSSLQPQFYSPAKRGARARGWKVDFSLVFRISPDEQLRSGPGIRW